MASSECARPASVLSVLPADVRLTDFHSHILPKLDDGSASVGESVEMLNRLSAYGVGTVILTPHFYAREKKPEEFFADREVSLAALRAALPEGAPRLLAGAEVHYFEGLQSIDELARFRIGGTRLILIEMPFCTWNERMVRAVLTIHERRDFRVILAHTERYRRFHNERMLAELAENGVLLQSNAAFFCGMWERRRAFRALKNGMIDLIGSDCHNLTERAPDLSPAYESIFRSLGAEAAAELVTRENRILQESLLPAKE